MTSEPDPALGRKNPATFPSEVRVKKTSWMFQSCVTLSLFWKDAFVLSLLVISILFHLHRPKQKLLELLELLELLGLVELLELLGLVELLELLELRLRSAKLLAKFSEDKKTINNSG